VARRLRCDLNVGFGGAVADSTAIPGNTSA